MNEPLVFVTGNYGKYMSVRRRSEKYGIDVSYFNCDIDELETNDVFLVSKDKAEKAYQMMQCPCFVRDIGFYIEDYPDCPNYPGAFVKRSGISSHIEELLEKMKGVENRNCKFVDCLSYYDGEKLQQFVECSEGVLANEKRGELPKDAYSRLWEVFIPQGYSKTLAEMTDVERRERSREIVSSIDLFFHWYLSCAKDTNLEKVK